MRSGLYVLHGISEMSEKGPKTRDSKWEPRPEMQDPSHR